MTLLDRFLKQPDEIKIYQIDYAEWLFEGEVVTGVTPTVTILNPATTDVGEPTLTVGASQVLSGNIFEYSLSAGTHNKRYKITFLADTSDSQRVESEIEFKVNDL